MWKIRSPYKLTIEEVLLFLYGFFGTMPILEIGGNTLFVYLTILVIGWNLLLFLQRGGQGFTIQPVCCPLILITVSMIISAVGCLFSDMDEIWTGVQFNQIILVVLYLLFFLFYTEPERRSVLRFYVWGVYAASVFQMCWVYAQLLYEMNSEISLNETVLCNIFNLDVTLSSDWNTALTGLSWHSSNLAPLLTLGFAMCGSVWLRLFFALAAVLCGNRTALIGVAVCAFCQWVMSFRRNRGGWKFHVKTARMLLVGMFLFCMAALTSDLGNMLLNQASVVIEKFTSISGGEQGSYQAHLRYWTSIPQVLRWADLWNILFGFGLVCSGYPMNVFFDAYPGIQWVIECDYVNVLWSNGLVGLVLLYGWYLWQMYRGQKLDKKYLTLFIPLLVMGVTYNVLYNWCTILLYCIFLLSDSGVRFEDLAKMEERSDESGLVSRAS